MPEKPSFSPEISLNDAIERIREKEGIIENVVFNIDNKPSGSEYNSRSLDRKIIILEKGSPEPVEGIPYKVKILKDTKPEDPKSGKYIVRIISEGTQTETVQMVAERPGIEVDDKVVRINGEETPVFHGSEEALSWQLNTEQFREQGETMVEISFKRSDGLEIKPGVETEGRTRFEDRDRFLSLSEFKSLKKENEEYLKAVDTLADAEANEEKKNESKKYLEEFKKKFPDSEWVLRGLRHLNSFAVEESKEILERDPYFVETPYVVETLEKLTRLINRQRERKQGIVILEGDAGTGKNKLVDHFAYLTKRQLFRFTCSAGKDEQDLKYLLEYDAKKGTYRIKSTVIEALETPGAILEFDEINTLKPEVAKMLNSLFDHDRAIFLGEDRASVKAAEEVVMIGLQNPQHYMGVKPLAETIKSRARIMEVGYPPFKEPKKAGGGFGPATMNFRVDEALILKQHVSELKNLSNFEFEQIWNCAFNTDRQLMQPQGAEEKLVEHRFRTLEGPFRSVKGIVEIANKIRDAYRAYHEGKSDDQIKFTFSLRESVECAYELPFMKLTPEERKKGITRAKKAVQEVVLPKIALGEERVFLKTLIETA